MNNQENENLYGNANIYDGINHSDNTNDIEYANESLEKTGDDQTGKLRSFDRYPYANPNNNYEQDYFYKAPDMSDVSIQMPVEKKSKNKKENKENKVFVTVVRKGSVLVASAAVFGLVAGGVFQYVSRDAIDKLNSSTATEATSEGFKEEIEDAIADAEAKENNKDKEETSNVDIGSTTVLSTNAGMDVSQIVTNAMPSVVSIHITAVTEMNQGIFGSYTYESEGSGSGIIIDKNDSELMIVTNNHVVSDAETVKVDFIDGSTYDAKVKSTDEANDLAIIVVPLSDLSEETLSQIKTAQIGSSDNLQVGEQVVAIGNALGYGQSVTTGIVSALNRENSTNSTPLIQTDAAINPGNSGGALLNMKGELIGINSSKYASTEVEGMGYAIPISSVTDIIDDLKSAKTRDKVEAEYQGYLGIECGTVTSEMQYYYGAPAGVYVSKVTEGLAADKAGLPKDVIITKFDGKAVTSVDSLTSTMEYYSVGEIVKITYSELDGEEYVEKTIDIQLGKRPNTSN